MPVSAPIGLDLGGHGRPVVAEHLAQGAADLPERRLGVDGGDDCGHRIVLAARHGNEARERCIDRRLVAFGAERGEPLPLVEATSAGTSNRSGRRASSSA